MSTDKRDRIRELTDLLNRASKAYYSEDKEIMSNFEYDALYDELETLEKETGIQFANSPTQNVGYEVSENLEKVRHDSPMLSLDKTKDPDVLASFLGDQKGLLSWKLDGLTVVLTYDGGTLEKAVTRGNGEIGEIITANARTFVNLPLNIPYKGRLTLRGEAVIKYSDFNRINEEIPEADAKYKNPRNLCSGSVRQLDSRITAERSVNFFAFSLESAQEIDFNNSNEQKFAWLSGMGFDVVPYRVVYKDTIKDAIHAFADDITGFDVPSDGLVLLMDDIAYGKSLGTTAKFPRNSMAFKWKDEIAETTLKEIEWSPSRTGLINPVAIFDPVELEGTTVSRASLHNLSIIDGLELGIGDRITVYKANMIIPQIAENLTKSGHLDIPEECPACGQHTIIKNENGTKTLVCPNPDCPAKKIKSFTDFVSRNAMNIEGVSEETLEKFIGHGFISDFSDIFHLDDHKDAIINLDGFGLKSYENIINSVNAARNTTCDRLLNALGILNVGPANAKLICRYFNNDFRALMNAETDELINIENVGSVIAASITDYFADEKNREVVEKLLNEVYIAEDAVKGSDSLKGMTFVITGSLNHYENRDALKAEIEAEGGKVAGSVSAKTSYLINNDILSGSSKNKKAKELNIPIITEEEYINKFRGEANADQSSK